MWDLTGFQRDILYVVSGLDAPSGLGIKSELDQYYEREVDSPRLYINLDILVDKGFIVKDQSDGRTNAYSLTARAERELVMRREWENQQLDGLIDPPPEQ